MEDEHYPSDLERLTSNIESEIWTVSAVRQLDLDDATVNLLASAIAVEVDYAFSVHWAPNWVRPGEPHRWTEGAAAGSQKHFVECLDCKRITSHATQGDADGWWNDHRTKHG